MRLRPIYSFTNHIATSTVPRCLCLIMNEPPTYFFRKYCHILPNCHSSLYKVKSLTEVWCVSVLIMIYPWNINALPKTSENFIKVWNLFENVKFVLRLHCRVTNLHSGIYWRFSHFSKRFHGGRYAIQYCVVCLNLKGIKSPFSMWSVKKENKM